MRERWMSQPLLGWLLVGCLCCALGCQIYTPGACNPCHSPARWKQFEPACPCPSPTYVPCVPCVPTSPKVGVSVGPPATACYKDIDMPLTYTPTRLLSRALRGVAELVAATTQFQTETGKSESESLDQHCRWPEISRDTEGNEDLPVPLALVSMEASANQRPLLLKPFNRLADGELFLQIALPVNVTLTDQRDQFGEASDRFALIMQQMLELGSGATSNHWQVYEWAMSQAPGRNDVAQYPFVDEANNPLRVWIFPAVVSWKG